MNTDTPIVPDVITTTQIAVSLNIRCMSLTLFETATFMANLADVNGGLVKTQIITLTTEQYLQWNNNDEYIVNLIAGILGVTPIATTTS